MEPNYLIFIHVISTKHILLEGMSVDDAEAIFFQHGVVGAAQMDKGELKSVYRHLVLKNHPDKGGSTEDMQYLNAAYDVLKDAEIQEPPRTDPSNSFYGRTMPKKPGTKAMLDAVQGVFKDEYDNSVLGQGWYDFFDLVQIARNLERHGVEVSYDPLFPIDPKTGQWLTDNIVIYCNMGRLNQFNKQAMRLYIRKLSQQYSTTPKKSA